MVFIQQRISSENIHIHFKNTINYQQVIFIPMQRGNPKKMYFPYITAQRWYSVKIALLTRHQQQSGQSLNFFPVALVVKFLSIQYVHQPRTRHTTYAGGLALYSGPLSHTWNRPSLQACISQGYRKSQLPFLIFQVLSHPPPIENALLLCMSPHIYITRSYTPKTHKPEISGAIFSLELASLIQHT